MAKNLDDLETDLRADGLRITRQRLAILHVLREARDHPRVEDILTRARQQDASVSQATVYRTLAALEKSGAVLRNDFDGAGARYELADRAHHDHLIDLDTGRVIEFRSDKIERLQDEIAAELGYEIEWHRLELYARKRRQGSQGG
ncbi:Fur family transcriptional regulator [Paracoccus sp. p4-l81]|uniref:Fur family transcriptional regulator n=1 Tax=unclassified Paracoccus (in: a-proteobacteria) TaxID=2688777 RepID=UPI0035B8F1BA